MAQEVLKERIGHYVVEAPLGRGSMGTVYLARDQRIGRRVAIKQVHLAKSQFEDSASAAEFYKRLQREAEICGSLQHPNIVTLYDVGYEGNRISYLALEYVAGETLLDLLKRHRPAPLPLDLALRVAADVLRGLAYAHGKGIIHRDIKPANILITEEGVAKIADFGIARPQVSSMTVAGALMGTPNYMPPEHVKGIKATTRSDLFSAGVLIFEMVTAVKPFAAGDLASILEMIVRLPTPSAAAINPEVSAQLDAFIQRLTAKSPDERFATAGEALDALEHLRSPVAPLAHSAAADIASEDVRTADEPEVVGMEVTEQSAPPRVSVLRRVVPAGVFLGSILTAVLAAAIPSVMLWSRIDARPTAAFTPAQLAEFAQKREALRSADELFRAGEYAESLKGFEAYLAKYPYSAVARDGAERARRELAKLNVERRPSGASKGQQQQKRSLLQDIKRSVKRVFRGD